MNETWLNEYVNSNEIVEDQYYKCFRLDRNPENKLKYGKKRWGGVFILCRQDLDVNTRIINIKCSLPIYYINRNTI